MDDIERIHCIVEDAYRQADAGRPALLEMLMEVIALPPEPGYQTDLRIEIRRKERERKAIICKCEKEK